MTVPQSRTSVLVVEDDPVLRLCITDDLSELGFELFEAADAQEAIDQLTRHETIGVMFTDVDMPGDMNGIGLAELVKDRWPPVRIIVTSGEHRLCGADLPPASRFLPKPYTPATVATTIRNMVGA